MIVKTTGILSSLRSVWQEINPLASEGSFSTYDHLEVRVHDLEEELSDLRRELVQARAALAYQRATGEADRSLGAGC